MKNKVDSITITLKKDLLFTIYPIGDAKIFEIEEQEALKFGEAPIQILESKRYEYEFSKKEFQLNATKECIPSKSETASRGIIQPGNYVGTLELQINGPEESFNYQLEVLATKFDTENDYEKGYRENYRSMLENITDKCTELLMQSNSPVNQYFKPDFSKENKTIYQKFSFVKSVLNKDEFEESVLKIISAPKTNWVNKEEQVDIRSLKKITNKNLQEIVRGTNRIPLPNNHHLRSVTKLHSVPSKINSYRQEPSLDNPENRFVKHTLQEYLQFCENCSGVFEENSKDKKEADFIVQKLENFLNHSFFKEISRPTTLKLNSPTLQRKGGYRQLLRTWLMFDLASKLTWEKEEDNYQAGKRDIATLYEYWLFFVLYDLLKEKFKLDKLEHNEAPYQHLFEETKNGLNLIIKSGHHTALKGNAIIKNRALNIKFSFNRTFSGNKNNYPKAGSWTTAMRPDYTLSVWPQELSEKQAEKEEQITHIHFDAKYKVNQFVIKTNETKNDLSDEELEIQRRELNKVKQEEQAGTYKNADLLKMHAYKDAIRRTGGAYVLYPGTKNTEFRGFHELIPGLGAFSVNPKSEKTDVSDLSNFIDSVVDELVNRASQRENSASKRYSIHKEKNNDSLNEPLPEYLNNEKLIPDETYVLVGFSKNTARLNWYNEHSKYNFRMNDEKGSLTFLPKVVGAKFLLLRESGKSKASILYKLKEGVKVYTKEYLEELEHPSATKDHYLVYEFEKEYEEFKFFEKMQFNFRELEVYKKTVEGKNIRSAAGEPFTVSLTELMQVRDKE
jgi:predicted component of viral defense system (DUF524 family)